MSECPMGDPLVISGWIPVVNGAMVPTLLPTKALALEEAKRIGDMVGTTNVSANQFLHTTTQEAYREMLRPYVSEEDQP